VVVLGCLSEKEVVVGMVDCFSEKEVLEETMALETLCLSFSIRFFPFDLVGGGVC
jgi:hypothetical protein